MKNTKISLSAMVASCMVAMLSCQQNDISETNPNQNVSAKVAAAPATSGKIWVLSDLTDPSGNEATDKDDIVALSNLLMKANQFTISGIVVGSTSNNYTKSAKDYTNSTIIKAYNSDRAKMDAGRGGLAYPTSINILEANSGKTKYNNSSAYTTVSGSIKSLVDAAKAGPITVLCWGPLTEAAIAIKHLTGAGETTAIANMTFIGHWTSSNLAQDGDGGFSATYNCRKDANACSYMHSQANQGKIKYYELGGIGQIGFADEVDGLTNTQLGTFKSELAKIWKGTKTPGGNPDGSDISTLYVYLEELGLSLSQFSNNGKLTTEQEKAGKNKIKNNYSSYTNDLLGISKLVVL